MYRNSKYFYPQLGHKWNFPYLFELYALTNEVKKKQKARCISVLVLCNGKICEDLFSCLSMIKTSQSPVFKKKCTKEFMTGQYLLVPSKF